jgi:hypothetical protein
VLQLPLAQLHQPRLERLILLVRIQQQPTIRRGQTQLSQHSRGKDLARRLAAALDGHTQSRPKGSKENTAAAAF